MVNDEQEDTPIFTFDSAALAMLVITSLLGLFCIAAVTGFLVGYYK